MKYRYIIALIGLLTVQLAQAQWRVLWNNGTKVYSSNVDEVNLLFPGERSIGPYVVKVMVFNRVPDQGTRQSLEDAGVIFHNYLPHNAWMASVPRGLNRDLLKQAGVAGIYAMGWHEKASKRMLAADYPEWGQQPDGTLEVNLLFLPNTEEARVQEALAELGARVVQLSTADGHVLAHIQPRQLSTLTQIPFFYWIQEAEPPAEPENFPGRTNHRVNAMNNGIPGRPQYDGTGVVAGHGDDGDIGPHIDYKGRLTSLAGPSGGNHGDHVAGTIMGAGNLDPLGKGMAPGAELIYYDYPDNLNDIDTDYGQYNIRVTNSSYSNGCNAGYTTFARQMDVDMGQHPKLMHVFSAGNSGTTACGYGPGISTWGNITGGHKVGKNVIAVGNLTNLNAIASSSSRGPAHDGRIKPEVSAVGTNVYSTYGGNIYASISGTSMACPGTVGTMLTLIQAFKETHAQQEPDGGLMKALLMNTSDDLGNAGPDFIYGFGRINARRALEAIESNWFLKDSVAPSGTKTHTIDVPAGTKLLKVMVYWNDPAALPNASRALINDLNTTLTGPGIVTPLQPWVLDPTPTNAALSSVAVQATDSLNNQEQITLANPSAGIHTLTVNGTSVTTGSTQHYYLVYYFEMEAPVLTHPFGGEPLVPGTSEIFRWDAPAGTDPFTLEYSIDSGATWVTIGASISASARQFTANVPAVQSGKVLFKLTRGSFTSISAHPLSIIGVPNNIQITKVCPDTLTMTYNAVPGAGGYVIYRLGSQYMDSVGYATGTTAKVTGINPQVQDWLAVAAIPANGGLPGRRSLAVTKAPGLINCTLTTDVGLTTLLTPTAGPYPNCHPVNLNQHTVEVTNPTANAVFGFGYAYSLNGGPTTNVTFTDTLAPGQSKVMTIAGALALNTLTANVLKSWVTLANDQNVYNDTLVSNIQIYAATTATLPFADSFENQINCSNATNCGSTVCALTGGWRNATNGTEDQIDFRTYSGATPSSGTGPTSAAAGTRYLYLEASGSCTFQEAKLFSPCYNLANSNLPLFQFKYHMWGAGMGELHVDVIADGQYFYDVMSPLAGDQGNQWNQASINLAPFNGKIVTVVIRGITGSTFASDLAIDDIQLVENTSAPQVVFQASKSNPCLGETVTLQDQSLNGPTAWQWTITPATYQFVNGTNATQQNPQVQFNGLGNYTVELKATNSFGTDSTTTVGLVQITAGAALPQQQAFAGAFPPGGWAIANPDGLDTWLQASGLSVPGGWANAAYVDNFSYDASGEEDYLISQRMALPAAGGIAQLVFEVAYARFDNTYFDGLRVDVSTDCGNTFVPTGYLKSGTVLATEPDQSAPFTPTLTQWRTDTIDLGAYLGQDVIIRFANINGYGNRLYIGNVRVNGTSLAIQAGISSTTSAVCAGSTVTYSFAGLGNPTTYQWNFGTGATPATANTVGPHQVTYATPGNAAVELVVSDGTNADTAVANTSVEGPLIAAFVNTPTGPNVLQFNDMSSGPASAWYWNFGDGNTSALQNPQNQYNAPGVFQVTFAARNSCGWDTTTATVVVASLQEGASHPWKLYPNPAQEVLNLDGFEGELHYTISNALGQKLSNGVIQSTGNKTIDVSGFPSGAYVITLDQGQQTLTIPWLKR